MNTSASTPSPTTRSTRCRSSQSSSSALSPLPRWLRPRRPSSHAGRAQLGTLPSGWSTSRRRSSPLRRAATCAGSCPVSAPTSTPLLVRCRCCPTLRRSRPHTRCGSTGCWPGCSRGGPVAPERRIEPSRGHRAVGVADRQRGGAGATGRRAGGRLGCEADGPRHGHLDGAGHRAPSTDLLVITSTFGDGDPPDNGSAFWDLLNAADTSPLGRCALCCARPR